MFHRVVVVKSLSLSDVKATAIVLRLGQLAEAVASQVGECVGLRPAFEVAERGPAHLFRLICRASSSLLQLLHPVSTIKLNIAKGLKLKMSK